MVVEYKYDAWGNVISITGTLASSVGNANPFRYRGYYYDTETGLYYLQSRYYDPQVGRFLNADGSINANGDITGFNMFAYCSNNPVMGVDPSGYGWFSDAWNSVVDFCIEVIMPEVIPKEVVEVSLDIAVTTVKIIEDIKAYDTNNTDEQVVLNSNYFSNYKGKFVLRTNLNRSGSFGILFINQKADKDTVRHEYGHTKQLDELGIIKYTLCVGIPSWQEWGTDNYYDKPWEIMADIYGGVQSRTHTINKIIAGYKYQGISKKYGILAWSTIK